MLVIIAVLISGCQTARVSEPVTAKLGGREPDQQIEFWHTLAQQPITSNDDAFHGLLLYLDGDDAATDYAGRTQTLRDRGLLPAGFGGTADQAVRRGTLAVAIAKSLKIRGGLFMTLTGGVDERYATRELQYRELFPPSSPNQTFSGAEFLGIMGKFEDAQREAEPPAPVEEPSLLNPERQRTSPPDTGGSPTNVAN